MLIDVEKINDISIAIIKETDLMITDVQSALDFVATISYESDCNYIIFNKSIVSEDFFDLSTKLAGEILQKFVNYNIKAAVIGDFTNYTSKSLKDFMYESNNGKSFFFASSKQQALNFLSSI